MPTTIEQHNASLHQPAFSELLPVRDILNDVIIRTTGALVAGYELSGINSYYHSDDGRNRTKLALEAAGASVDIMLFEDLSHQRMPNGTCGVVLAACQLGDFYELDRDLMSLAAPMLGICNGAQLMAQALGGSIRALPRGAETGVVELAAMKSRFFRGLPKDQTVQMHHEYEIEELPAVFRIAASTARSHVAAYESTGWPLRIGVQFHPEEHDTTYGPEIMTRFVRLARIHRTLGSSR